MPTLLWFRQDLRLADNPALAAAIRRGQPIIPVFIWAPEEEGDWPPGAASRWWLRQSLASLEGDLRGAGSRLIIRRGPTRQTLQTLLKETGARAVFWNHRYEPAITASDSRLQASLKADSISAESFNAALLHEPWSIQNKSGKPFQVFTPFWRHCLSLNLVVGQASCLSNGSAKSGGSSDRRDACPTMECAPAPKQIPAPTKWPRTIPLAELELEPRLNWTAGLSAVWKPGTAGATDQLRRFIATAFADYSQDRNRPDLPGTSRLSPHLHFGEISPRQIWHALRSGAGVSPAWSNSQFLTELGWREFAHHLLQHFPHTPTEPLRAEFNNFPWHPNPEWLRAWQRGRTGVPLVDAGMRELWATGWMHNRVRMVVASFLVKNLLIPWQEGARWFWDTLVDADLAQNTLGWQWTAGCGADAAPYFRIFNPVSQGQKFDLDGNHIRRWIPELAKLPAKWIHQPWAAPANELAAARVQLGATYPEPIVSLAISREVALAACAKMRGQRP
jgi:deoxyribodipyrimidine photo-lyase